MYEAVKSLNKKDIYITNADKCNCVVVLNKSDYDAGILDLIENGNYERVRNPLNKMFKATQAVSKVNYSANIGQNACTNQTCAYLASMACQKFTNLAINFDRL